MAVLAAHRLFAVGVILSLGQVTWAAGDADRLGKDLTPLGAEVAANKDGTIPAWSEPTVSQPGWTYGKRRGDFFKYAADKPIYSIDASSADKHKDKLSPGQLQLLKNVAGYRMDVYPSRRTCSAPDYVAANTRKNVSAAKLAADGWGLQEAVVPGIPFPMPGTGVEAMWNNKLRYRGVGQHLPVFLTAITPGKGGGELIEMKSEASQFFPWGAVGSKNISQLAQVEVYQYYKFLTPTALAGQASALTQYLAKPSEAFYYFPGQRRVRRMPTFAYDSPIIGMENQYMIDQAFMFNGAMDRFDWTLVGKKEVLVPYNSFGLYDVKAKVSDVVQPNQINPDKRRYELHRVWVVEAKVKSGVRHLAPKRTFYIDEDSWAITLAEDYDEQGKLWKIREAFTIPVYELGSCDNLQLVQYDLQSGRYLFDLAAAGTGAADFRWFTKPDSPLLKASAYTAEGLSANSER